MPGLWGEVERGEESKELGLTVTAEKSVHFIVTFK